MHFLSMVPLWLGITFVVVVAILKGIAFLILGLILLVAWLVYYFFFKEEEAETEQRNPEAEFWDKMIEDQERNDAQFYKSIGKIEAQQEALEKLLKNKKR